MAKWTTKFEEWIDESVPETDEEAYFLYKAFTGEENFGNYDAERNSRGLLISRVGGTGLILVSQAAEDAFARKLEDFCPDKELGWEGWYEMYKGRDKD